jgi:ABC-type sugar transport system substrate-binding protein
MIALDKNMNTDVTASVVSGNQRGGATVAIFFTDRLAGKDRVVHIRVDGRLQNVSMRRTSFLNECQRRGLHIVKTLRADSSREQASTAMKAHLMESPGFDAAFAKNDATALSAVEAMWYRSLRPWPAVMGLDGVPEALEAIRKGMMEAALEENPGRMGEKAMELFPRHSSTCRSTN